jgi:predicted phosphate transport protein (TIGR00153 family)
MLGLGRLIPRDQEFFALFNELATQLVASARLLNELFEQPAQMQDRIRAIKEAEHKADQLTYEVNARIDRSFVTPIDREDIHLLATRLDDVIDLLDGTARRAEMLHVGMQVREPARTLSRLLVEATQHIQRGVNGIKRTKDVNAMAIEVKRIEEEGDAIYHDAVEALFEGQPDPLDVIRWKEIYDHLEESIDSCMGIVHALQGISFKNA